MIKEIGLIWLLFAFNYACDTGSFWQVTDIHYDANYSSDTSKELEVCRQGEGHYGEYPCDSPWTLVTSALTFMHDTQAKPDFILWTGDSVPHEADSELNSPKVFTLIKNVTDELIRLFPNALILPSIGNHDIWPSNQVPPSQNNSYFHSLLTDVGWDRLLNEDAAREFLYGGRYRVDKGPITLLNLNTILWYDMNNLTRNSTEKTDPLQQFSWLKQQLQSASEEKRKVIIFGHVPPGMLARAPLAWYQPWANREFNVLLKAYRNSITAVIFGHEHTDSFRVVMPDEGEEDGGRIVPMFMAPAVTPWKSTIPGLGANNPSVRLYHYCQDSGNIIDYDQYFLNLTRANEQLSAGWELEYSLTKTFNVKDASGESLLKVVKGFKADFPVSFDRYFRYNSVSEDMTSLCRGDCIHEHVCAMIYIDYDEYQTCRNNSKNSSNVVIDAKWFDGLNDGNKLDNHNKDTSTTKDKPHKLLNANSDATVPRPVFYSMIAIIITMSFAVFIIVIMRATRSDPKQGSIEEEEGLLENQA